MVKNGTTLLISEPFVHVLSNQERGNRCDYCFQRNNAGVEYLGVSEMPKCESLRRCSACQTLKYCSTLCQKFDWKIHRKECQCFKKVSPQIPVDSARLLLRITIRFEDRHQQEETVGLCKWKRSFQDLMSHEANVQLDSKRCEQMSQLLFTLQKMTTGVFELPTAKDLLSTFGKMVTNSFSICDDEMQPIGVGIYLGPSLIDHRCEPNAVITFQGKQLHLRSTTDIDDPQPSNVFISYIDQLASTKDRKQSLQEQYYFDCTCTRCQDQSLDLLMSAVKCPMSECIDGSMPLYADMTLGSCLICGNHRNRNNVKSDMVEFEEACVDCLKKAQAAKTIQDSKKILELCEKCLSCHNNVFHPLNLKHVKILDFGFDACIDLGEWEKALKYGLTNLEAYRKYYPSYSPNLGLQLMKIGKILLFLQNLQESVKALQQAGDILNITHGSEHPLCRQLAELIDQAQEELRVQHNAHYLE